MAQAETDVRQVRVLPWAPVHGHPWWQRDADRRLGGYGRPLPLALIPRGGDDDHG